MSDIHQQIYYLGIALAIGLLIGLERGWKERSISDGGRIAGIRTYGLIGLLGGSSAVLAENFGLLTLSLAFIGLSGVLVTAYIVNLHKENDDVGITSLIASLLTFVLGALAAAGEVVIASTLAVVTTLLLSYKPLLHGWVKALDVEELQAGFKLLLISVVLLPILPNQGYGPWKVLNPYEIWWMVVLIAIISFIGYFAIKIAGARRGALYTGLFSGLASSTALTLHFSRMSRKNQALVPTLSLGILLACGTMFPRILLIEIMINFELFRLMLMPAIVMAVLTYLPTFFYWRIQISSQADMTSTLKNPLELKTALIFGFFLTLVMLFGKALQSWFGDTGVLFLAAASGVTDVDAINLSLARMSQNDLVLRMAAMGVIIAASVNNLTKAAMATVIGGRKTGLYVGIPLIISSIGGLLSAWLWVW